MKAFILKNKKILYIGLAVLSILFIILAVSNLSSTERGAYKSMYDANNELRETYIEAAEKYELYGYSSKSQLYYAQAYALDEKLERYESELTSLNIQMGLYLVLAVGSIIGVVLLFKIKSDFNKLTESQNDLNVNEGE